MMSRAHLMLAACLVTGLPIIPALAASDPPVEAPVISCGNGVPGGIDCVASKKDEKAARKAYSQGLKLEERKSFDEAFAAFDEASKLNPEQAKFFSAREVAKSQIVFQHTQLGDAYLSKGQRQQAAAEFQAALSLDPDNSYMRGRLAEAIPSARAADASGPVPVLVDSDELHLQPTNALATFHYTGDVQGLFTELASAYGMTVEFDESVKARQVRFYVDNVDFFTALNLACKVSESMWAALDPKQFLVAASTTENHKMFDRMALGTFSIPGAGSQQEATEMVGALRNICEFQKIGSGQLGTVQVRAPQPILAACTQLLKQMGDGNPQVALQIEIYEIDHNFTREIGMHLPDTFNLYNIPVAAIAALGGQSIQSLVNQLISSGGINQAGSSALSGLLAQLQGQGGIFSQPLATFGGGLTFSGVSLDQLTAALSLNESWSRSLSRATLRTGQGKEATLHIGERYPILNASYAPIYNSPQISQVLGNNSYVAPFPSVSYEDLGLNIKATTAIHGDESVSLKLELQVRSLTGNSANGVPVISNQEYQGSIRLRDGEPAVVAGEITTNDQFSMAGIPGLAAIPGINQGLADNTRMKEDDELLLIITPHIVADRNRSTEAIWVTQN
ncbi:MAG: tetratricopeptide repeat protein [Candidatus Sulfotelmatobacter sp.]|jgi:type II secretory pathway component GspD/PulD (secretin)